MLHSPAIIVTPKREQLRRPFVTVKYAQSLDGRIATETGDSRWISGPDALRFAHKLRAEHDAILVGIGTVLADDPALTVRLVKGTNPLRVVVDSRLRIPLDAQTLADVASAPTLIATARTAGKRRLTELHRRGAEVLWLPDASKVPRVDLASLLDELCRRGMSSVLVEGGRGIITSMLKARAVDRLIVITAPKIIGEGTEAIGDLGITRLSDAITFASVKTRRLGDDLVFDCRLS